MLSKESVIEYVGNNLGPSSEFGVNILVLSAYGFPRWRCNSCNNVQENKRSLVVKVINVLKIARQTKVSMCVNTLVNIYLCLQLPVNI